MILGDILAYRGLQLVQTVLRGYSAEDRVLYLELKSRVTTVGQVTVDGMASPDVQFYGAHVIGVALPERITGDIALLAPRLRIAVYALSRIGQNPQPGEPLSSLSIGFGQSVELNDGAEEALQRSIRFLLMSPDPLEPGRGGGLLAALKSPLLTEEHAKRLVILACSRYSGHIASVSRSQPTAARWVVRDVSPRSIVRTRLRTLTSTLGGSLLWKPGDEPVDETEMVYSVVLVHTLKSPHGTTSLTTTTAL